MQDQTHKPLLYIPKPCHEDWDAMTPQEQGRHCAVCDKVLTDFSGMEEKEFGRRIEDLSEGSCGRFRADQIADPPLGGTAYFRYPLQRMRVFFLALVAVFGLEVLGLQSEGVQASGFDPVGELAMEAESKDSIVLKGKILSDIDQEPVMYVTVLARQGDEVVAGVMSDAEGNFELKVPTAKILSGSYDLVFRYLGRERVEREVGKDVKEVVFFMDNSYSLADVILAEPPLPPEYDRIGLWSKPVEEIVGNLMWDPHSDKVFYRPMDEWLMMHNSEINHTGRW